MILWIEQKNNCPLQDIKGSEETKEELKELPLTPLTPQCENSLFPLRWRYAFFLREYFGKITQREEARGLRYIGHRHLRCLAEQLLGILYAQADYPLAERHAVSGFYIRGEVGTVGA